jgi:uncharacterized protein HemX
MKALGVLAAVVGIVLGAVGGYLWWGVPLQRSREEMLALERQRATAEVANERLKELESRLKRTEEALQAEKDRRAKLEFMLSQGRK